MSMRQQFLLQKWASSCIFVRHRKGHMVPWNHQGLLTLSYLNWEHRERLALHCMAHQSIGTSGDEEAQFGSQREKKSLSRWRSITKKGWDGCKRRHSWIQVSKSQLHGFSSPGQERWHALLCLHETWSPLSSANLTDLEKSPLPAPLFIAVIYKKKRISVNHLFVSSVCLCTHTYTYPQIIAFVWNSEVFYKS